MSKGFDGIVAYYPDDVNVIKRREVVGGMVMVMLGLIAIANPLWLDVVTHYPGTDWTFLPVVHAAFTTIGLIGIVTGICWIQTGTPCPTLRMSVALAGIAIVAVPLYWHVGLIVTGITEPLLEGYGARRSFIAGLLVAGYLLGISIGSWKRRQLALALLIPILPGTLVAIEWTEGALLTPVLEAYFFFTGAPVLGIPRLGTWVFLGTVVLGFLVTRVEPPEHQINNEDRQ